MLTITSFEFNHSDDGIGFAFDVVPILNWAAGVWVWFPCGWYLLIEWEVEE